MIQSSCNSMKHYQHLKWVTKHVMKIPMLLPWSQDNSVHSDLLGKYKVTSVRKKKKTERLHITSWDALPGSHPYVRIHNSMTSNKENTLAETKSLAFIFIKGWESWRGGWKEFYKFHTPAFPKSFWELFSKITHQKWRKNGARVKCLYGLPMPENHL